MTNKSRYFLIGASLLLLAGIGVGMVAYYRANPVAGIPPGLPDELRYVPATAELVAYADIHTVMNSELRRELERAAAIHSQGKGDIHDVAGIDLEKQVNHIVAYLDAQPASEAAQSGEPAHDTPRGLLIVQGTFEQPKVEEFIREHGGTLEDYHGKQIFIHRPSEEDKQRHRRSGEVAVGFLQPSLIALGNADLVRGAIDLSTATTARANVTSSADLMTLVRAAAGETAWVVGRFDAVSRRMGLPSAVRQQVPPLRMVSAKAHINGGVRAVISAETADQAAADQFRDVIRGFVAIVRMQAGAKPELQNALKSLELGGTGSTVQLSFAMTPETFRALVPQREHGDSR
jgi:hypothetical protein